MQCLVIYDIPDDRARQRVADACLDYGLQRIQYSAFAGNLSRAHQRALFNEITRRLKDRTANVQLFVFDAKMWEERRVLEQNYDNT
ncbi:MAG: CRISPR-associated endonuclease Cas2 [Chloroflexus aggregans]|uniref:CRISPR-associated endoribonuclease Cas2 n=1 Tax=Chloroflexus aggregans TaxID=152260 RepID=A0A2J6X9H8_9CHLR|nr:MAG: CRISPR-associated endonuclease Cas2 [Chloroflexus aggregans]